MKKIPVLATIQAAYQFAFAQLGAIIGLIWLPMVLVTVMGFFIEQRYYAAGADALASNNIARLGPAQLAMLFYVIAALLLYAMMYVSVVQLLLGQRKEPALVHFAFGPIEWRLFRALLGLFAFLMFPVLFSGFLIGAISSFAAARLVLELLLVLLCMGVLYVALRFVFFLPALAVSEEGPLLLRAWTLSAGNFWRILLVAAGVLAPVEIIALVAKFALGGVEMMAPVAASSTAMMAAALHNASTNLPVNVSIDFLLAPLVLGLAAGASAAALQALKPAA